MIVWPLKTYVRMGMNELVLLSLVVWSIFCVILGMGLYKEFFVVPLNVKAEAPAFPMHMADNSEVLMRDADAKLESKSPMRPIRHSTARVVEATLMPKPVELPERVINGIVCPKETVTCPPVEVRWDLLKAPDETYRSQISSNAEIIDGVDKPIQQLYVFSPPAHGLTLFGTEKTYGLMYNKHVGKVRYSLGAIKEEGEQPLPLAGVTLSF